MHAGTRCVHAERVGATGRALRCDRTPARVGCGLFLYYSAHHPALVGLGLRRLHVRIAPRVRCGPYRGRRRYGAFHAAEGQAAAGCRLLFSLGHSTVVLALAVAIIFAATAVKTRVPALQDLGGIIGAGVSGTFLWVIGILNCVVLVEMLDGLATGQDGQAQPRASGGIAHAARVHESPVRRPAAEESSTTVGRCIPSASCSALGFDTASEVGLLAMTAGASAGDIAGRRGALLADPVRRRHDGDGHDRRRADGAGVRLGLRESAAQDFLQRRHYQPVDRRRADHRLRSNCSRF